MPKRSNEFQKLVGLVRVNLAEGAAITESKMLRDRITGTEREVDVCVEGIVGGTHVRVCIECRDRARAADVTWVEELKAKHERLPTHVLILASRSGFTNEARRVAQLNGIEAISFDEVEQTNFHDLFKGKSSLFAKCITISADKVVVGLLPTITLPAENVVVQPDNAIFNANGVLIGLMGHLVMETINSPDMLQQLLNQGDEQHRWFVFQWESPRDKKGMPIFLQKLEPLVFRVPDRGSGNPTPLGGWMATLPV